ncbi:MAG: hypothetical protein Q9173_002615 [Seirophora scorigena]
MFLSQSSIPACSSTPATAAPPAIHGSFIVSAGPSASNVAAPTNYKFFKNGLNSRNVDIGLVHLSAPISLHPEPAVGELVPRVVLDIVELTNTSAATIMWGNPYELKSYVETGFFQTIHGDWLIFDLKSVVRMEFSIQWRDEPGVQLLDGIGTFDVRPLIETLRYGESLRSHVAGEGGINNSTLSIINQANANPWLNSSSQSSQAGRPGGPRHLSERVNGKDNARLDRTIQSDQDNQPSPTQPTRPLQTRQFES